jgi:hypothetical protein
VKTSWIIFIALAYIAIFYFAGVAEYANQVNATVAANLQSLGQPTGTNWLLQQVAQISEVWNYIKVFIQMVFLWNGTLWAGSWLWFYYAVCLPICIGVVMSIVFILRGVHSS